MKETPFAKTHLFLGPEWQEIPAKIVGKVVPAIFAECSKFQDLGHQEGKPAANLRSALPGTLSTPSVRGVF